MTTVKTDSLPSKDSRSAALLRRDDLAKAGTIMIIDDEPINVKIAMKYLREEGYENFVSTSESRDALEIIRREQPDVILLDIMMPHVTGLDILEQIRSDDVLSHLPVLILTASTDEQTKIDALEIGATDFLSKPVQPIELLPRIKNALILKANHDQMAVYSQRLERKVRARTAELARSREELIHVLARAAEYRDHETGNHVVRVSRYTGIIARQLGFSEARATLIEKAAILHDVGKIGVSDVILLKPDQLDNGEMGKMKLHCQYGLKILRGEPFISKGKNSQAQIENKVVSSPFLMMAAIISMSHHEKWDGSGYPLGLAGDKIPLEGRIVAVADVFDALRSKRPYKEPLPFERCTEILEEGRGRHFDPQVLEAFFARIDQILQAEAELVDD